LSIMTPEERQVITGIFERLKAAENQPRDPEAEKLIADLVARQPYAPYAMAQSIYVSEQAIANLGRRIEQLERDLAEAKSQAKPQSGGFLSNLFGGPRSGPEAAREPPQQRAGQSPWGAQPPAYAQAPRGYAPGTQGYAPAGPMAGTAPQPGPWGGQPQGGFLQSALTTAAGVAGGMVLGNMLTNAFSHHGGAAPGFGTVGDPLSQGFGAQPLGGQGFEGQDFDAPAGQDLTDAGGLDRGEAGALDRGGDALDDRSQDDAAIDHDQDDMGGDAADDPGFGGDDPDFSGDV